ncbi:hypothetical protein M2G65_07715 [Vibrio vulnificus]|nr:hypothetical protein [Vibrio vulnificus]
MRPIQTAVIALSLVFSSLWADTHLPVSIEADVLLKTTTSWDGTTLPEYPKGQPGSQHFENYRPEGRAASHAPTPGH